MKEYFVGKDGAQAGPFSIEEMRSEDIGPETLVWKEGWEDWRPVSTVAELQTLIPETNQIQENDPVSGSEISEEPEYDYSQIEDIAGVDYKKAMLFTAGLLVLNIPFNLLTILPLGMAASTVLSIVAWLYFKAYFDALGDTMTGKWILAIMISYAVFGLSYIISFPLFAGMEGIFNIVRDFMIGVGMLLSGDLSALIIIFDRLGTLSQINWEGLSSAYRVGFNIVRALVIGAFITSFIAGFRLLKVNKRYPFPLKRIALSAMIMIPFLFMNYAVSFFVREGIGFIQATLLNLPYIFLFHHFYRADNDDATPDK